MKNSHRNQLVFCRSVAKSTMTIETPGVKFVSLGDGKLRKSNFNICGRVTYSSGSKPDHTSHCNPPVTSLSQITIVMSWEMIQFVRAFASSAKNLGHRAHKESVLFKWKMTTLIQQNFFARSIKYTSNDQLYGMVKLILLPVTFKLLQQHYTIVTLSLLYLLTQ